MAQYPVITAGTKLTATLLSSMMPNYVVKTAATNRTSTTTFADDPDLVTGTLTASGVYLIEFHVRFAGLNAAGFKTNWTVPSGTSGDRETLGPGSANATESNANTTEMRWAVHGFATNAVYTNPRNSASSTHLIEKGMVSIGVTAGTVALSWAQNVSNATATTVQANSYVKWVQVG